MQTNIYTCYLGCLNYSMIFEFEHPLLGLYLTSEQNFDYWTYFQLGFSFSFKGMAMKNWMDLNGDGKIDGAEMMFAGEMLCTSREEHEALFGDAGDFEDDAKDDFEIDAMAAGLDVDELELMDPDDRAEALEDAGLDPEDYDFD